MYSFTIIVAVGSDIVARWVLHMVALWIKICTRMQVVTFMNRQEVYPRATVLLMIILDVVLQDTIAQPVQQHFLPIPVHRMGEAQSVHVAVTITVHAKL